MVTTTVTASQDSYYGTVFSKGPNDTATTIHFGGWGDNYYSFIQFDITSAPASSTVYTAQIYLYQTTEPTNSAAPVVYRVTSSWDETTLTDLVNPTYSTAISYAFSPAYDKTVGVKVIDVTQLYKDWKDATYTNYGVTIRGTFTTDSDTAIASTQNATAAYRPYLLVTEYSEMTGVSTVTGLSTLTF